MSHLKTSLFLSAAVLAVLGTMPASAEFGDSVQQRQQRWTDLEKAIFNTRTVTHDEKAIQIDAPGRPDDASLVPVTITVADPQNTKAIYLVIDDNPSPVAAHFTFGAEAYPKQIKMRVRVNAYTDLHAIAETKDGKLLETAVFVKASGGCSAPAGMTDEEAMRGMGEMKVKLDAGEMTANQPAEATLLIRHPNFNGMQMNQVTRFYTPARYIEKIGVAFDGKNVFDLESDISLSANPVIHFAFLPDAAKGQMTVQVEDSKQGRWSQSFIIPAVND
jgi:sulfur-oxidizing protein SoxY